MSPWSPGVHVVRELIAEGKLSRLQGADAGVEGLMTRAGQQLASARSLLKSDPVTAYIVAYDAAKHAGMALLAEQNLRATAQGGHIAIEQALAAQFKGVFDGFGRLRRRRNELDYPTGPEDSAETAEAERALGVAASLVESARRLLDERVLTTF
ncbi:MAG: hypothetical protein LH477_10975 [Nocardioides sp.]|nr:hypothetical protein [Nocardioides sp.]